MCNLNYLCAVHRNHWHSVRDNLISARVTFVHYIIWSCNIMSKVISCMALRTIWCIYIQIIIVFWSTICTSVWTMTCFNATSSWPSSWRDQLIGNNWFRAMALIAAYIRVMLCKGHVAGWTMRNLVCCPFVRCCVLVDTVVIVWAYCITCCILRYSLVVASHAFHFTSM